MVPIKLWKYSLFYLSWWRHQLKTSHYWPFVRGIHQSPVDSPQKGQWHGALTNGWANDRDAGELRWHHAHYDITVMHNNQYQGCWWRGFLLHQGISSHDHGIDQDTKLSLNIPVLALEEFSSDLTGCQTYKNLSHHKKAKTLQGVEKAFNMV